MRRGNAGAGAGATVGKSRGSARAMKGGIGSASLRFPDGLVVAALIAVNAVGDVVDPADGRVVAGVRDDEGNLADARRLLLESLSGPDAEGGGPLAGANTTIGVVAVNAPLTKAEANKVAEMAHDGLARTIYPVHTPADGDTLFALSTGRGPAARVGRVGALAAEAVARASWMRSARRSRFPDTRRSGIFRWLRAVNRVCPRISPSSRRTRAC